jgi:hypothetical protein
LPNRSDTGGVGARLRAKIAWIWFLILAAGSGEPAE